MEDLRLRMKGQMSAMSELLILPIYSNLPSEMQAKIFDPTPSQTAFILQLNCNIQSTFSFPLQLAPGKSFLLLTSPRPPSL